MSRLFRIRSKKAGLPPGTLVHIGERRVEQPRITIFDYDEAEFNQVEVPSAEACYPYKDKPTVTWINIDGIHDVEIIEKIGSHFNLHPLLLEDIVNTDQRPKLEDFTDYVFIVLKMLNYDEEKEEVRAEQVSIILGPNFVISFQEEDEADCFGPIRERLRNGKGRIRKEGADYLAYALLDAIVDNYFLILEKIGEDIEEVEDALITDSSRDTLFLLQTRKREMLYLRKSVWPLREVIGTLERNGSPFIKKSTLIFLRDVYDHTIQVIDTIELFRETLSSMLDIYLSSLSNKMNEVMKVLTIIATLFIPLTFIAGVYGMNFRFMPELEWRWGYPAIMGIMFAIGVGMLFYFRKKKWL